MKVLYTTDLSREGNDCYISESVSLIEAFGMYTVLKASTATGWAEHKTIFCPTDPVSELDKAKALFIKAGGKLA